MNEYENIYKSHFRIQFTFCIHGNKTHQTGFIVTPQEGNNVNNEVVSVNDGNTPWALGESYSTTTWRLFINDHQCVCCSFIQKKTPGSFWDMPFKSDNAMNGSESSDV